jgi:hypothetical protein
MLLSECFALRIEVGMIGKLCINSPEERMEVVQLNVRARNNVTWLNVFDYSYVEFTTSR